MKMINRSALVLITALTAIGGTAYGQVPSTNDTSDGNYNTGSGTGTLFNLGTGSDNTATGKNALVGNTSGSFNTAAGSSALQGNTKGNSNSASGYQALDSNGGASLANGTHGGAACGPAGSG